MQTDQAANAAEGAFNFLDLPKELRIMVYEELFGERPAQQFPGPFDILSADRVLVMDSYMCEKGTYQPQKSPNPAILSVNQQLRAEAGEIYYSKGQDLYLDYEYSDVLEEILSWADNVVGDLAIHLRDIRVHITAFGSSLREYVQFQQIIHLKFSPNRGLTTEGWKGAHLNDDEEYQWTMNMVHPRLATHAAAVQAVSAPGRLGGSIIDFFSLDHNRLRDACFGPPIKPVLQLDLDGRLRVRLVACHSQDPDIMGTRKRFW